MPIKYIPIFEITPKIASFLMRVESARRAIQDLPISLKMLSGLRESARASSIHYSTKIEGNRLSEEQVVQVIQKSAHFPGRERDVGEVRGYYAALDCLEQAVLRRVSTNELLIQTFHAHVMGGGLLKIKPTPYREGQNVIRDSSTGGIVYMPPEAKDVPGLMGALVRWIEEEKELPLPLIAGIAHYQFATIHPYYDGNGRTARLLATFILHKGGYGLKGIYSLEEYYAKNLQGYYDALSIGPSHNYYLGRAAADITKWVEYFCEGMAESFEKVVERAKEAANLVGTSEEHLWRELDLKKKKALELFQQSNELTSIQIGALFQLKERARSLLCQKWVEEQFIIAANPAKRSRKYKLSPRYISLLG